MVRKSINVKNVRNDVFDMLPLPMTAVNTLLAKLSILTLLRVLAQNSGFDQKTVVLTKNSGFAQRPVLERRFQPNKTHNFR